MLLETAAAAEPPAPAHDPELERADVRVPEAAHERAGLFNSIYPRRRRFSLFKGQ
jgi:hypothetical protein